MKIADISVRGRFPPPLTAHKRTAVGYSPTAKNSRTVSNPSVVYSSVAVLFDVIKDTAAYAVAGLLPPTRNLRTVGTFGLQIQYGLLTEKDEQLPFAGHVVSSVKHIDCIQHLIVIVLVRS